MIVCARGQTAFFAEKAAPLHEQGRAKKVVSPRFVRKEGEKGFALLFVFLMAAIVGLYLYSQLPRVAFESERDKEQLLIDRGEQYKRAIQLYVGAVKKYPSKIEDLENTNDKRYLRHRYIDPMTGKDEWRLIHVNAGGVLTDSLVQKPPSATPTGTGTTSGSGTTLGASSSATFGSPTGTTPGVNGTTTDPNAPPAPPDPNDVNSAVRRRPSDVVGAAYSGPATADPNDPSTWAPVGLTPAGTANGGAPTGQPPSGAVGFNGGLLGQATPGQPGQLPGQAAGQLPGLPGQAQGQQPGGFPLPGQPGFNPTQNQFKVDANGQLVPIQPTQTGAVINSQTGGVQNTPAPTQQPGVGGLSPGNSPGVQNLATQAINQMLTNPNPAAGANGLGTAGGMTTGGIAGVASNYKGTSIKIYGGRQKYQEWEFIFSLNDQQNGATKNASPLQPGQNGLTPGQPGQNGQNPPPIGSTTGTTSTGN
jgi:hypothetical protein